MNAETPTVNIALCGYYGKHNLGDDLVADSLKNRLTRPGTIVTLYSDDNTDDIKNGLDCGYLQSDIIVFGGGTIVTPDFWVFQKHRLDQLIESGKPVTFLNVTITTEMTSNSDFVQSLKRLNANWWVRDKQSADLLLGVDIQAKHMPDISCTLDIKTNSQTTRSSQSF